MEPLTRRRDQVTWCLMHVTVQQMMNANSRIGLESKSSWCVLIHRKLKRSWPTRMQPKSVPVFGVLPSKKRGFISSISSYCAVNLSYHSTCFLTCVHFWTPIPWGKKKTEATWDRFRCCQWWRYLAGTNSRGKQWKFGHLFDTPLSTGCSWKIDNRRSTSETLRISGRRLLKLLWRWNRTGYRSNSRI